MKMLSGTAQDSFSSGMSQDSCPTRRGGDNWTTRRGQELRSALGVTFEAHPPTDTGRIDEATSLNQMVTNSRCIDGTVGQTRSSPRAWMPPWASRRSYGS